MIMILIGLQQLISDIRFIFLILETGNASGIDAARLIREKVEDWNSLIVIVTAYDEYRYTALTNRLFLLDFISKCGGIDDKILSVLKIIMKHYDTREKCLTYEYNYMLHKIEFRKIVYIEKEQESKRFYCLYYVWNL